MLGFMKYIASHFQNYLLVGAMIAGSIGTYPAHPALLSTEASNSASATTIADPEATEVSPTDPTDPNLGTSHDVSQDPDESPELPEPPVDEVLFDFDSELIIKALNPGYTIDGISNVGEFIELQNLADAPLALAGYSLQYTNGSGNTTTLFTFPDGSYLAGKHLLLRYFKSPSAELSDITYRGNGLAMNTGPLQLVYNGEVVDSVCWTGKEGCLEIFHNESKNYSRTTLVRNLSSGEFEHLLMDDYEIIYDLDSPNYFEPEEPASDPEEEQKIGIPQCRGLELSELLTYYTEDKSEQFIELFNPTGSDINLNGCQIGYKSKTYPLSGIIKSGQYFAFYNSVLFALTKNPQNPLIISIIDADGEAVDEISYGSGQKKSTSYSRIINADGTESWQVTYTITPGVENIYQKFRTCEAGKIINEATGNCVKVSSVSSTTTLAACPEGQYRNPLTNRCKKIETSTSSTLKECAEGYERNPETNRCRKVTSANDGADYALVPATRSDSTVFIGLGIACLIVTIGLVYICLQFRHEISRATRVASQRLNHIRQNLLSRRFGRDSHKKP